MKKVTILLGRFLPNTSALSDSGAITFTGRDGGQTAERFRYEVAGIIGPDNQPILEVAGKKSGIVALIASLIKQEGEPKHMVGNAVVVNYEGENSFLQSELANLRSVRNLPTFMLSFTQYDFEPTEEMKEHKLEKDARKSAILAEKNAKDQRIRQLSARRFALSNPNSALAPVSEAQFEEEKAKILAAKAKTAEVEGELKQ